MVTKLTENDIITTLRNEKEILYKKYGVISIGLFGSYAKGIQTAESDIDIMVELKEPRYDWLAGLQIYLEQKFKKKVELVRKRKQISARFVESIEEHMIYA